MASFCLEVGSSEVDALDFFHRVFKATAPIGADEAFVASFRAQSALRLAASYSAAEADTVPRRYKEP